MNAVAEPLRFVEDSHQYFVGKKEIPGVTTIIKPLYDFSGIDPAVLNAKRDLGIAVHRCSELYDDNELDEDTVADEWRPYFAAWVRFRKETGFNPSANEKRIYHSMMGYAGTLDRAGLFQKQPAIIDIKTTAVIKAAVGVQLSAYEAALRSLTGTFYNRFSVQLKDDGSYRLDQFKDPHDFNVFSSLLTVYKWTKNHAD